MGGLIGICLDCFKSKDEGIGPQHQAKRSSSRKGGPKRGHSQHGKPAKQKSISKQHLLSTDPSQGYCSTGNQSPPSNMERRPSWGRLPQSPGPGGGGEPPRSPTMAKPLQQRVPNEPKSKKGRLNRSISLRMGPEETQPMRRSFRKKRK